MAEFSTQLLHYQELDLDTLYALLQLRAEVFVVEQKCAYQDIDGKDQNALHLLFHDENGLLAAYARIMHDDAQNLHVGRVLVRQSHRKKGLGKKLMGKTMDICKEQFPKVPIVLNAQLYLEQFYKELGFTTIAKPYPLDGILHVDMVYHY